MSNTRLLLCHRCNKPYAEVCDKAHDHHEAMCVYGDWWDDVRTCECGETIHKNCEKDSIHCPKLATMRSES